MIIRALFPKIFITYKENDNICKRTLGKTAGGLQQFKALLEP